MRITIIQGEADYRNDGTGQAPEATELVALESLEGVLDIATVMLEVVLKQKDSQESSAYAAIDANAVEVRGQLEAARQAAREAAEHADSAGFWSTVGSIAKVVAVAASCVVAVAGVVTGGALTVAALALAGVLISAGSGKVAQLCGASEDVQLGVSIAGAVVGTVVGGAAALGAQSSTTVQTGATAAGAVANGVQGSAAIGEGMQRGAELDSQADATAARARQRSSQREIDGLVAALKELNASFGRIEASLCDSQQMMSDSRLAMLATLAG